MKFRNLETTEIWNKFEKIKDQHRQVNLNSKTEKCIDFFNGRQWRGIARYNEDELVSMNIIQPIVKYKTAMVAQQDMAIIYSPMNTENTKYYQGICEKLNSYTAQLWEKLKMYTMIWKIVQDACIAEDSYLYFYDGNSLNMQIIDNINIFLADEQQDDIQKQPYIIIYERRNVADVRKEAEQNGVSKEVIENILSDDDTDNLLSDAKIEVKNETNGKCSCLLMLSKNKDGIITVTRSTKTVVYQNETPIFSQSEDGNRSVALKVYPIVNFIWQRKKGSARGIGEVEQLIPNQIAINKNLVRIEEAVKLFAFPRLAVNTLKIANTSNLDSVGSIIEVNDKTVQSVKDVVDYLAPQQLSTDAYKLGDELINTTMKLKNSGDAALGNIDPTKASGTAIMAVRDQSAIPLNEQIATLKQFIEDIALILYQLLMVYNPQGIEIPTGEYDEAGNEIVEIVPSEVLQEMKINIKIDVLPNDPYTIYAKQQALDNFLTSQFITFDEYVSALDNNAPISKGKLEEILNRRKIVQEQQMQMQGGMQNAMQIM